jgi:deazaflavin-dependent oxidoreductase (nitroreductase family)
MPQFEDLPNNIVDIIKAHVQLYLDDPEKAHMWDSTPVGIPGPVTTLLLTTTGRKTGKPRHVPLLYVDNDGSYLIIGSKGGNETDPVWYLNLLDSPECEIRVSTYRTKAKARVLTGEERAAAWAKVTAQHPVYNKYQGRTGRQIPVVLIEPVARIA